MSVLTHLVAMMIGGTVGVVAMAVLIAGREFKRNNKRYVMRDDGAVFESVAEAARESGCSPSGVSNVICGNRKSIKGMTFTAISEDEYADEIRELLGGEGESNET